MAGGGAEPSETVTLIELLFVLPTALPMDLALACYGLDGVGQ